MAVTFCLRGDSFTPRKNGTGGPSYGFRASSSEPSVAADAGAIGGSKLRFTNGSAYTQYGCSYNGVGNWPAGIAFSLLMRVSFVSLDANSHALFYCGGGGRPDQNALGISINSTNITIYMRNTTALTGINNINFAHGGLSNATWYDIVLTGTGDTTTNGWEMFLNASSLGTTTSSRDWLDPFIGAGSDRPKTYRDLQVGHAGNNIVNTNFDLNELCIFDSIITPSSVSLTSGTGSLNGASRTAFVDVTASDGSACPPASGGGGDMGYRVGESLLGY